jgi:UDP-glucose 4-epimerase
MKCLAHLQQDQLPVTIMRFFNTTGPRQSAAFGMVAPRFIDQALKGQAITVYGSGKQTRSFCSVFDTARAIQQLMNQPTALGIFNIGNPDAITIEALAKHVIKITGSSSSIQYLPLPPERIGQSDIHFRKPDINSITKRIGWKPNYTWEQTLQTLLPQSQPSAK